jgi:hypothetical protein
MENKILSKIIKEMYTKGLEDEAFVMEKLVQSLGGVVYKSTKKEDTKDHIDFWWEKDGEKVGVDVKGIKKNKRSDSEYDDTINWIELLNVKGDVGWIYGKAKYIAFRTNNSIIFIDREMLLLNINSKIKGKDLVTDNPKDCYIPYQRKGRSDMIVKVPTVDLKSIAVFELNF